MKTFNLLSIGQRGVGKTVFLAGSYTELNGCQRSDNAQQFWLDCKDRENIENILGYIAQTAQYPPPTIKINNFSFSLKRRRFWGIQTLCHFHWYDIPGEICNVYNSDFKNQVLSSHGCCVFINAKSLAHDTNYLNALNEIITEVSAIADLVAFNHLKYFFALICTQCDQLELSQIEHQKLENKLQPLTSRLDAYGINYQQFNSAIPIISVNGTPQLKSTGAAAPLLWLNLELRKLYKFRSRQHLSRNSLQSLSPVVLQATTAQKILRSSSLLTPCITLLVLALLGIGILGTIFALSFDLKESILSAESQEIEKQIRKYEQLLQQQPNNVVVSTELSRLYISNGQPKQAEPLLEKLTRQHPQDLDLRLNLARLYEIIDRQQQAETIYDQVLAQEKNNITALLGKAILRSEKGDYKAAKVLFAQAEEAVPQKNKLQVRALAQTALQSQVKLKPSID